VFFKTQKMKERVLFSGVCEGIIVIFEVIGSFSNSQEYLVIPSRETGSVVPVRVSGDKINQAQPIIN
jgi:hypothetical protein